MLKRVRFDRQSVLPKNGRRKKDGFCGMDWYSSEREEHPVLFRVLRN